jgi:STE24 endopeptidase
MAVVRLLVRTFLLLALVLVASSAMAQPAPSSLDPAPIPAAAAAVPLDPDAATEAYLATIPPEARAASDAYFEGGYWLQGVDFLVASGIAVLLLHTGFSAKMRDRARRVTSRRFVHVALYWLMYLFAISLLGAPLSIYEDFVREHAYGLSNMSFGAWAGDQLKGFGIGAIMGALVLPLFYAVLRRAKQTWWMWGAGLAHDRVH